MVQTSVHETWSSKSAFVLAAVGAAVGLGNIWRFPFIAGQNGGGAFVLVYIGFVLLLGIPIIAAELAMGRRGQQSAVVTMSKLAREENSSQGWQVDRLAEHPDSNTRSNLLQRGCELGDRLCLSIRFRQFPRS